MGVSSRLALLSLGTIGLLCLALAGVANADYDEIHTVKHCSPNSDSNGGAQCKEENEDAEDEFDDTYKIIDNVAVSLSPSGRMLEEAETETVNKTATAEEKETTKKAETEAEKDVDQEDSPASEEEVGNLYVLGH